MAAQGDLDAQLKPLLDWLGRHFNAHRFLWFLALASFLVAWNRGLDLLYGLLALVLALLAISWLLPWLAIRGIRVERQQSGAAQAGKTLRLEYRVSSRKPAYHLTLHETLPCRVNAAPCLTSLPAIRREIRFTREQPCDRRGVFTVHSIRLGCGWPFGLVHLERVRATPPCQLVVMPRTFKIEAFPALRSDIPAMDGYNQTARPDINSEFAGVREYRFGDSLKHIHWSASARHQTLIVREYESHDRPHLLVVIDGRPESEIGDAPMSTFEQAVTIAASLIEYAVEQQIGLHLVVGGLNPLELSVPPGARDPYNYLEPLAWVKADGGPDYAQLVAQARERFGTVNALVTLRNEGERAPLPPIDTGHLDILFQEESYLYPVRRYAEGWQPAGPDHQILWVNRNSDLEELFGHDQ
ncbi:DUF58 domain-containing protein [Marinobacteraceae bacterium S3BR75-40.1]